MGLSIMVVWKYAFVFLVAFGLASCSRHSAPKSYLNSSYNGHTASTQKVTVASNSGHPDAGKPLPLAASRTYPAYRPTSYTARSTSPAAPYMLDSGDHLRVRVFGQDDLSSIYNVDGSGFITLPLIGAIKARGRTTFELSDIIAARLRNKYVRDAKVTVEISTHRPFFILGEVRNPGQFAYVNGMSAKTAVAIAGGFSPRARESQVQISRRVHGQTVTRSVSINTLIRPGDTIYVKERFF